MHRAARPRRAGLDLLLQNMLVGSLVTPRSLSSSGKSGSFFFLSADGALVIKSLPATEAMVLKDMLPAYAEHVCSNVDTMLVLFYGLYQLQLEFEQTFFVVMTNGVSRARGPRAAAAGRAGLGCVGGGGGTGSDVVERPSTVAGGAVPPPWTPLSPPPPPPRPPPPPLPMFEADSQRFASVPRGFKLQNIRPALGGDHTGTLGGGGGAAKPPSAPLPPPSNTSLGTGCMAVVRRGCGLGWVPCLSGDGRCAGTRSKNPQKPSTVIAGFRKNTGPYAWDSAGTNEATLPATLQNAPCSRVSHAPE